MESEEKLAINWLNERHRFDEQARNRELRIAAFSLLTDIRNPVIADLGSGSGNNALSLLTSLNERCRLMLIEQHDYLLKESQRRIDEIQQENTNPFALPLIDYYQNDLHNWMCKMPAVDLLCNNALLDLFTEAEFEQFINGIAQHQTAVYSTLNYSGISFEPAHAQDSHYVKLFEQHMCRQLDRGSPLGPHVHSALLSAVDKSDCLKLAFAISPWRIKPNESKFMRMNLSFYQRGIKAILNAKQHSAQELSEFNRWMEEKYNLLECGHLTLTVQHYDYLITPLEPQ